MADLNPQGVERAAEAVFGNAEVWRSLAALRHPRPAEKTLLHRHRCYATDALTAYGVPALEAELELARALFRAYCQPTADRDERLAIAATRYDDWLRETGGSGG